MLCHNASILCYTYSNKNPPTYLCLSCSDSGEERGGAVLGPGGVQGAGGGGGGGGVPGRGAHQGAAI